MSEEDPAIEKNALDYEKELIFIYTGKTMSEILNDYTMPEILRLNGLFVFTV